MVGAILFAMMGCTEPPAAAPPPATDMPAKPSTEPVAASQAGMTPRRAELWASSCALCHVAGQAGAPVVGDTQAWAPRLAQGHDALVAHTLQGLNDMPPLGYCMACETADFEAMIAYMAGADAEVSP